MVGKVARTGGFVGRLNLTMSTNGICGNMISIGMEFEYEMEKRHFIGQKVI